MECRAWHQILIVPATWETKAGGSFVLSISKSGGGTMMHAYNPQYLRSWGRVFEFKTTLDYIMRLCIKTCTKTKYKVNLYKLVGFPYINHKLETIFNSHLAIYNRTKKTELIRYRPNNLQDLYVENRKTLMNKIKYQSKWGEMLYYKY